MNRTLAAMTAFSLISLTTACSTQNTGRTDNSTVTETVTSAEQVTENQTEAYESLTLPVTSPVFTAAAGTGTASSVTFVFEPTKENMVKPDDEDDESAELSMLENAGDPDYSADAAIPYVAWTEINLDKYMYAVSVCTGYSAALEDAGKAMIYDPGYEFHIIARTSTGYYRTDEDLYIPCRYLDNYPPDGYDPENAGSYAPAERPDVTEAPAETDTDDGGEQ